MEDEEIPFIFTEDYYLDILADIPQNSAAALLVDRNMINSVSFDSPKGGIYRYIKWWQYLIAALVTVLPLITF